jgi:LPS-assembly lipoprotein
MSLPERRPRLAATLLALGLALLVGGCFRPMYASVSPAGPSLTETLAAVEVEPIKGRVGQQVRNNLDFGLTGGAGAPPPRYTLRVALTTSRISSIIDPVTNEPQIDTVALTGSFELFAKGTPAAVLSGKDYARKSFDRGLQRFAALRAARDAEDSAAKVLADQIRGRVAIYLAEHP